MSGQRPHTAPKTGPLYPPNFASSSNAPVQQQRQRPVSQEYPQRPPAHGYSGPQSASSSSSVPLLSTGLHYDYSRPAPQTAPPHQSQHYAQPLSAPLTAPPHPGSRQLPIRHASNPHPHPHPHPPLRIDTQQTGAFQLHIDQETVDSLAPAKALLEQAWALLTKNVTTEVAGLHAYYRRQREEAARAREENARLRHENARLVHENARLRRERNIARLGEGRAHGESEEFLAKNRALTKENVGLVEDLAAARGEIQSMDRRREDPGEMWRGVRETLRRDVESRVSSILSELQDQRLLRIDAEKKLADLEERIRTGTLTSPTPAYPGELSRLASAVATPSSCSAVSEPPPREIIDLMSPSPRPQHRMPSPPSSVTSDPHPMPMAVDESADMRPRKRPRPSLEADMQMDVEREWKEELHTARQDSPVAKQEAPLVKQEVQPAKREAPETKHFVMHEAPAARRESPEAVQDVRMPPSAKAERVECVSSPVSMGAPEAVSSSPPVPPQRPKISISHIQMLFTTNQDQMLCRLCILQRSAKASRASFPLTVAWHELVSHLETDHQSDCDELVSKKPADLAELRERLHRADHS
ncbi:hypothetical protein PLICRDRAFT_47228 [Plicaturopsis crispa FD-325 SS-3]|uniref:Uncharacterized protein n=1 Tax=Plicaturopsis crispa FD-325 SS-3 TaxID=944288 RepID=A0A0C9SQ53_PLICR|nr:hypothetical protein PLICRDRAFT_47228 [Plicaturopsis crispa FD-325 SS-3]